jgi:hypothetical protein
MHSYLHLVLQAYQHHRQAVLLLSSLAPVWAAGYLWQANWEDLLEVRLEAAVQLVQRRARDLLLVQLLLPVYRFEAVRRQLDQPVGPAQKKVLVAWQTQQEPDLELLVAVPWVSGKVLGQARELVLLAEEAPVLVRRRSERKLLLSVTAQGLKREHLPFAQSVPARMVYCL